MAHRATSSADVLALYGYVYLCALIFEVSQFWWTEQDTKNIILKSKVGYDMH